MGKANETTSPKPPGLAKFMTRGEITDALKQEFGTRISGTRIRHLLESDRPEVQPVHVWGGVFVYSLDTLQWLRKHATKDGRSNPRKRMRRLAAAAPEVPV